MGSDAQVGIYLGPRLPHLVMYPRIECGGLRAAFVLPPKSET